NLVFVTLARIVLGAARSFLGGAAHHEGLLLALLALALGLDPALLLQHALTGGEFASGQRTPGTGCRTA
ncbi:MAG: hypothetical protein JWR10_2141, partial [Rubritepida sp.]|nr:hypothetical protein [Rubritepida sp.]